VERMVSAQIYFENTNRDWMAMGDLSYFQAYFRKPPGYDEGTDFHSAESARARPDRDNHDLFALGDRA